MRDIPIIQLTIKHMEHSIAHALSEYEVAVSEEIKHAVEQYCKPENIQHVIDEVVKREIDRGINRHVEDYFRYGDGNSAIYHAVRKTLEASNDT